MISQIKLWITGAVVAIIAALSVALKIRTSQYKKQKKKATVEEARRKHAHDVITHDAEVEIQVDERLAEVARGESDELTNPNDWS